VFFTRQVVENEKRSRTRLGEENETIPDLANGAFLAKLPPAVWGLITLSLSIPTVAKHRYTELEDMTSHPFQKA
jgi:hypothetical protein